MGGLEEQPPSKLKEPLGFQMDTQQSRHRRCARCGVGKPLSLFHKQPKGPLGHHSWCKVCANAAQKDSRAKNGRPTAKRAWNLSTRYKLTEETVQTMKKAQGDLCAICRKPMARMVIDHCHVTKAVRGLLCHPCNIKLPTVEDEAFVMAARKYLAR